MRFEPPMIAGRDISLPQGVTDAHTSRDKPFEMYVFGDPVEARLVIARSNPSAQLNRQCVVPDGARITRTRADVTDYYPHEASIRALERAFCVHDLPAYSQLNERAKSAVDRSVCAAYTSCTAILPCRVRM